MVGAWLYNEYPEMPEGDLTRMRSALVYTEQLAVFARELDLGLALRLGRGEMQGGGRDRDPLLCDAFEALIGALYLDGGIPAVERFMAPMLTRAADDILINRKNEDPKSRLQEWAQAQGYATPHYETTSVTGPDHSKVFEVSVLIRGEIWATGTGHSKQAAAKEASRLALEKIGQDIT